MPSHTPKERSKKRMKGRKSLRVRPSGKGMKSNVRVKKGRKGRRSGIGAMR